MRLPSGPRSLAPNRVAAAYSRGPHHFASAAGTETRKHNGIDPATAPSVNVEVVAQGHPRVEMPEPTIQVRIAQHLGTVAAQVLGPLDPNPVKRLKQQEMTSKPDGLPTLVLRAASATSVDNDGRIRDQGHGPVAAWEVPAAHGSANPELGHQCAALADLALEVPVPGRIRVRQQVSRGQQSFTRLPSAPSGVPSCRPGPRGR